MFKNAKYRLNLYLNGNLVGDVRPIAERLTWARRRTKKGADSIDFTLNDKVFNRWCKKNHTTVADMLKPYALECRVVRDGVEVLGGFLATMPAYSPKNASADLQMHFDGFLNLLAGVYIFNDSTKLPYGTVTGRMGALVKQFIDLANTRSTNAGKGFGFVSNTIDTMNIVTNTFDNYKPVKEFICDRCDNIEGAGPFDVYFYADKSYDVKADANFGDVITGWVAQYPADPYKISLSDISAPERMDYASFIFAVGYGEISAVAEENTTIISTASNNAATLEYGYCEKLESYSSVTQQTTLNQKANTQVSILSNPIWRPEVATNGKWLNPTPNGDNKIWLGDTITIKNNADFTDMTSGTFRVDELIVRVSEVGAETIMPTLERV